MTEKQLSKEEWTLLDKLLSKLGFGGYYDLVECIKQAIFDINSKTNMFIKKNVRENTNLVVLVKILNRNAQKLKEV